MRMPWRLEGIALRSLRSSSRSPCGEFDQHAALAERAAELLDEEGHAVGVGLDEIEEGIGGAPLAEDHADQRVGLFAGEAPEGDQRDMRTVREAICLLGPGRREQHEREVGNPCRQQVEDLERRGVAPVEILDEEQERRLRGAVTEEADQGLQGGPAARLRRLRGLRLSGRCAADDVEEARAVIRRRCPEQRGVFLGLARFGIVRRHAGQRAEHLGQRMERAVDVARRALELKTLVALGGQRAAQAEGEMRLADAGLAHEQHDLAIAAARLLPELARPRGLAFPADHGVIAAAVPGFEPGGRLDGFVEAVELRRVIDARDLDQTERFELELAGYEALRVFVDDHRAGLRQRLKLGSEVDCMADRQRFLRGAVVADDDDPGCDADAHAQRRAGAGLGTGEQAEQRERGVAGPLGVVLAGRRGSRSRSARRRRGTERCALHARRWSPGSAANRRGAGRGFPRDRAARRGRCSRRCRRTWRRSAGARRPSGDPRPARACRRPTCRSPSSA